MTAPMRPRRASTHADQTVDALMIAAGGTSLAFIVLPHWTSLALTAACLIAAGVIHRRGGRGGRCARRHLHAVPDCGTIQALRPTGGGEDAA